MATLVLTAVGTAVAGPAGAALGSLVGQAIDTQLFGPGPRRGPRLDDLKLQTSSYGTPIPRLYGRMRVAGTVVWATDLKEEEEIEGGGGKGSPETVRYAYSCSFAVALSARPILRVGRIWADGKLLRGASGDMKVAGTLRVTTGGERQALDPLLATIEGAGSSPAYRGLALAIFEDLALAEFGNRIPMLTFEVIADEDRIGAASIISDLCAQPSVEEDPALAKLVGYAAFGTDQRAAIEDLAELTSTALIEKEGRIRVADQGTSDVLIAASEPLDWSASGDGGQHTSSWSQEPGASVPAALAVRYHEPQRDYQAGLARATIAGGRGERTLDSAAAMESGDARQMTELALARRWAGRDRVRLDLSIDFLGLVPGQEIMLADRPGQWRVEKVTLDSFVVRVEARRVPGAGVALEAEPGRSISEVDRPIGATRIALFDLPASPDAGSQSLSLHIAVSSNGGFKSVPVTTTINGVDGPRVTATRKAKLGTALSVLPSAAAATCMDGCNAVIVMLEERDQILLHADADSLDRGANLAVLGDELIQFGRAEKLGPGHYRLSQLLRGRRGTEWAMDSHAAGEAFAILNPSTFVAIPLNPAHLGSVAAASAWGVADPRVTPPTASRVISGRALAPLAPCKVRARSRGDGSIDLQWVRRSVSGFAWLDGVEGQDGSATFRVRATGESGSLERTVAGTSAQFTAGEMSALGENITFSVSEIGDWRASAETAITQA